MASSNALKQININCFFKPCANKTLKSNSSEASPELSSPDRAGFSAAELFAVDSGPARAAEVSVTYRRRNPKPSEISDDEIDIDTRIVSKEDIIAKDMIPVKHVNQESTEWTLSVVQSKPAVDLKTSTEQVFPENKPGQKRVYGQYFLELGQSDFFLSTCSVCGLKYSRGDDEDEKVHKSFHKRHLQGVKFKGWQNERIVMFDGNDRIILVLNSDPSHHQNKVKEVVMIMEKEMGLPNEWLLQGFCKSLMLQVYLFISSKKIVGCLVSEPIKYGFRVIPEASLSSLKEKNCDMVCSTSNKILDDSEDESILPTFVASSKISDITNLKNIDSERHTKRRKQGCTVMEFGNIKFERKAVQETHSSRDSNNNQRDHARAILCSEVPVPAVCGVRGLWVSRSERRKGIATKLLDTMRKIFCLGYVLEPYQCAFSQPSSDGRAFASSYCRQDSFLIYKSSIHGA